MENEYLNYLYLNSQYLIKIIKKCLLGVLNWSLLGVAFVLLQCPDPSSLAGCGLKFSECITVSLMGKSLFPKG